MFDPKVIYENRAPAPLKDAPRGPETRPVCNTPNDTSAGKPPAEYRYFNSKWAGLCDRCEKPFLAGSPVVWHPHTKATFHRRCFHKFRRLVDSA